MKTARKWVCLVLALFAICGAAVGLLAERQQTRLAAKTVRLHVRANSDSEEDQNTKLLVRDAVLSSVRELTKNCQTADEAICAIAKGLPSLAEAASDTLRSLGNTDAVKVSLQKEQFPTRSYDTFRLPAGTYPALRVDIGQAAGHNWWCVVFPTLCASATTEGMEQAAAAAGFSDGEISLMTEDAPQIQVKFRVMEWFGALRNLFS